MDNHLPTFFTSNLTIDELEIFLNINNTNIDKVKARRIIERIKQLTENMELVSKNRRGQVNMSVGVVTREQKLKKLLCQKNNYSFKK